MAAELPSLLKWSESEQAFVYVNRATPSLPQLPESIGYPTRPKENGNSPPKASNEQSEDIKSEIQEKCSEELTKVSIYLMLE